MNKCAKFYGDTGSAIELSQARFTLSVCESDKYKVGYDRDPIHIRFGFSSYQYESLCLHWADRRNLCALLGLLRELIIFPSFRNLRKVLLVIFFCPVTMQSDPNVFGMPSLFSKVIFYWKMSPDPPGPPDPGPSQPNSQENFEQRFPRYVFAFHAVVFNKYQFFMAFRFPNLPTRFNNIRISRLDWAFSPLFGTKYPIGTIKSTFLCILGTIRIFFIRISIRIFLYPGSTGSTSDL